MDLNFCHPLKAQCLFLLLRSRDFTSEMNNYYHSMRANMLATKKAHNFSTKNKMKF